MYLAKSQSDDLYRDIFISTIGEGPGILVVTLLVKLIGAANTQGIFFFGSGVLVVIIATVKVHLQNSISIDIFLTFYFLDE